MVDIDSGAGEHPRPVAHTGREVESDRRHPVHGVEGDGREHRLEGQHLAESGIGAEMDWCPGPGFAPENHIGEIEHAQNPGVCLELFVSENRVCVGVLRKHVEGSAVNCNPHVGAEPPAELNLRSDLCGAEVT